MVVNGNYWGLMDMQEHFSTELLEKNKMRDSLIFTFSNDSRFAYEREVKKTIPYQFYWLNNPRLFLKLTGNSLEKLDKTQKNQYQYVESILREKDYQDKLFSKRHLRDASDLLNIWGDFHPFYLTNVKFYLNPFTLKLEPLMADQGDFITNKIGFKDGIGMTTGGFLQVASYDNSGNSKYKKLILNQLATYEPSYKPAELLFPQNPPISIKSARENFLNTEIKNLERQNFSDQPTYSDNIKCTNDEFSIPSKYPAIQAKYTKNEIKIIPLICGEFIIQDAKICNFDLSFNSYIKPKNISIYRPEIIPISNKKLVAKLGENLSCIKNKNFLTYSFNGTLKKIQIDPFENKPLSINPLRNNSKARIY